MNNVNQCAAAQAQRFRIIDPNAKPALDPRITVDASTGLEWQTVPFDKRMTWDEAAKACAELRLGGHSDWRLPTRVELLSLVDDTRSSPAIDTDAFPNTPNESFWTATPWAADPKNYAWLVGFSSGGSYYDRRGYNLRVRAVRGPARQ